MLGPSDRVEEQKPRVFLSSTVSDLVEERAAAIAALTRLGCEVFSFANETESGERRAFERSQRAVADCDLFMVIVGAQYGFVPPDNNLRQRSIVELELEHAERLKKPIFAYMLAVTERSDISDPVQRLAHELREKVVVRRFMDVSDLAIVITTDVLGWLGQTREGRRQVSSTVAIAGVAVEEPRPSIPSHIDPLELAWRLVVERVVDPTLLRHMGLDQVREAVLKWSAQTSRGGADKALHGQLDFARQCDSAIAQLRSKQQDSPNALWLAWMRATREHLLASNVGTNASDASDATDAHHRSHDVPAQS